jgi:hypothetical protein
MTNMTKEFSKTTEDFEIVNISDLSKSISGVLLDDDSESKKKSDSDNIDHESIENDDDIESKITDIESKITDIENEENENDDGIESKITDIEKEEIFIENDDDIESKITDIENEENENDDGIESKITDIEKEENFIENDDDIESKITDIENEENENDIEKEESDNESKIKILIESLAKFNDRSLIRRKKFVKKVTRILLLRIVLPASFFILWNYFT